MNNRNQRRAAPIIALLVIILGILAFVIVTSIDFNQLFQRDANPPEINPEPSPTVTIPATIPSDIQSEYVAHLGQRHYQVALYHLEADATFNGWTVDAHIRAGNLWRDMGDRTNALPHWEAANANHPNANLLRQIAEIYIERGEWGTAWERINTLLELAPNDAWSLYHAGLILAPSDPVTAYGYLGQVAALDNEFSETAQNTLNAIGETETNSDVILRVGTSLASAEEWSLAENAYQYAADVYYPFAEATAYVGLMRILQGKNGEAWISEALALDDSNANIHYIAGIYWRSAGEFLLSENELIQAVLLQPDNPTFHTELGNTYRAMGNPLDAEIWLQTAVIISNEAPLMVEALESFYEEDEAFLNSQPLSDFETNNSDTVDPAAISANGWALHILGNTEDGLDLINQVLAADPDNPRALFDKARIFLDTDRADEAIPLLDRLIDSNSSFARPAQNMIDSLQ